jgi:SAM-dependent methyltransferase
VLPAEAAELWEHNAGWWAAGFTEGADPEYTEQILPLAAEHLAGSTRVLDVGCGEGQICRLATGLPGVDVVVGVDPTSAQIDLAAARDRTVRAAGGAGSLFARAGAAALPFADASFDAAIACLVFEHITELDRALDEIGRVLRSGGRFVLMLNHPLLQTPGSGWIDDTILDEQYWRVGPYLLEEETVEEVAKNVWIPFVHRPLSRYVNGLVSAGMVVTGLVEPAPPPGFLAIASEYRDAATIPRLLLIRAERR